MKRLTCLVLGLAFACSLFVVGCGGGSGKTKIAFVTNNDALFWNYAEAGCKKAAEEFDVEVLFRRPPTNTATDQKKVIDRLMLQGIKGIAVSVIDPKNQTGYIDTLAAKIPVITQDNDAPKSDRLCYLGTDNYAAGRAAGELVKEAMPNGGIIAIFVGHTEPLNARQRRQGVLDVLADEKDAKGDAKGYFGKYRLYSSGDTWGQGPFTDEVSDKVAKENADKVLLKFPDEKNLCLIGLWGYNPPAMLSAVSARKRTGEVRIVGFDEYDETLNGIRDGHIHGTIVQDPYNFGYKSVKLLTEVIKGNNSGIPASKIEHVAHKVITSKNVDAFQKRLKELVGK